MPIAPRGHNFRTLPRPASGDEERPGGVIGDAHLADAIEHLTRRTTRSLSEDRGVRDPYAGKTDEGSDRHVAQRPQR